LRLSENIDHISSTEVRQRILAGQSINNLVPERVAAFVKSHSLYKDLSEDQPL
jgi:nicotinic acid mononucleotide adenylyltransferase